MTFTLLIVVLGLFAILFMIGAVRNMGRRRIGGSLFAAAVSLVLILIVAGALLVQANLRSYEVMLGEQPAGTLQFKRLGYHQFEGHLTYPNGESSDFELRGDEWQVDARVLKWQGMASLLGFDTAYRLDRIGGRYTNVDDERSLPRTVYSLSKPAQFDLWTLAERFHPWLPWIDALYGSAAFLPMADGASYSLSVSPGGLIARPVGTAAQTAVAEWR